MAKLCPLDAPLGDFESGMNGVKTHFAGGGSVWSSVVVVVTLDLVDRAPQGWQLYRNQAVPIAAP